MLVLCIHNNFLSPGVGQWHRFGASGASHGGTGGQGACSNHLACKLSRSKAYGDLYQPMEFGGGGSGARGGSGMFQHSCLLAYLTQRVM